MLARSAAGVKGGGIMQAGAGIDDPTTGYGQVRNVPRRGQIAPIPEPSTNLSTY